MNNNGIITTPLQMRPCADCDSYAPERTLIAMRDGRKVCSLCTAKARALAAAKAQLEMFDGQTIRLAANSTRAAPLTHRFLPIALRAAGYSPPPASLLTARPAKSILGQIQPPKPPPSRPVTLTGQNSLKYLDTISLVAYTSFTLRQWRNESKEKEPPQMPYIETAKVAVEYVNEYHYKDQLADRPEVVEVISTIIEIIFKVQKPETLVEDGDYGTVPTFYYDVAFGKWDQPYQMTEPTKRSDAQMRQLIRAEFNQIKTRELNVA